MERLRVVNPPGDLSQKCDKITFLHTFQTHVSPRIRKQTHETRKMEQRKSLL